MGQDHTQKEFNLYRDIQSRTNGEIFIGVVGPVRTGKSTFIKRFMEQMVLPHMEEDYQKTITQDEMPQSAAGKTITTTEPKFVPKEAAKIELSDNIPIKVRLIDCVGYMVNGASGHMEDDAEGMVKTPWFDYEIPFTKAAEVGTRKVINDHSTIGVVVTTDGSISELAGLDYTQAEEKCIQELKQIGKPFIILLNTVKPYSEDTQRLLEDLKQKYSAPCIAANCEQLKKSDIDMILEEIPYEFPVSVIEFYMPKWVEIMPLTNAIKKDIVEKIQIKMKNVSKIKDITNEPETLDSEYAKSFDREVTELSCGEVKYKINVDEAYYYQMLSELLGEEILSEAKMLSLIKTLAEERREYRKVNDAIQSVKRKGYGVVMPERSEITLNSPEVIRHGNKYGVKMLAECPSIHMIKANIKTEIAPIVGSKEQAEDLITYIEHEKNSANGMWDTNIFGKTVEQLVNDGITGKINMLNDECQMKLQDTMQKIVNDNNGGMICIII